MKLSKKLIIEKLDEMSISVNTNKDAKNPNLIIIDEGAQIEPFTRFAGNHLFTMGAYSYSRSNFVSINIGRYCSIGRGVKILGPEHPVNWVSTSPVFYSEALATKYCESPATVRTQNFESRHAPITIGHDVWIGNDCILKPGISIGNGAVIAGNSVVTKDVPAYSIFGGAPATFLKSRFSLPLCEKLIELKWWNYRLDDLFSLDCDFSDVEQFCNTLERSINSKAIDKVNHPSLELATMKNFSL
jgi:acetyltransferase-like isoleucine patch superfamily enzyme